jgi:hypothetical protein
MINVNQSTSRLRRALGYNMCKTITEMIFSKS